VYTVSTRTFASSKTPTTQRETFSEDIKMEFKGKKIAVLGTGIEGLSSAKFLKEAGALVTLLDQKNQDQLTADTIMAARSLNLDVYWGANYLTFLNQFEIIVRTPSIRPDLPTLSLAKGHGALVTSNTQIFFDLCPCPIIGVTGTKGKGTTSTLIYEILKKEGKSVFLGGNIGNPPLDFLAQLKPSDLVVLELSSFQLFDLTKSPQVAVVLMVTSEHLDWHKDATEYKEAKFNIVRNQRPEDFAIVNIDYQVSREFLQVGQGQKISVSSHSTLESGVYLKNEFVYRNFGKEEKVVEIEKVGLIGPHNLENVVAAVGAASALSVSVDSISQAIQEFKGLEHRLELVREEAGVKFYNDSFSTTPETAIAAIKSFQDREILILGGSDKGSDYTELGRTIVSAQNVKALVLIGQMGSKIKLAVEAAGSFSGKILEGAKNMEEIVTQAKSVAQSGDVVLLSPACASFDMFPNYKERGRQFKEVVNSI